MKTRKEIYKEGKKTWIYTATRGIASRKGLLMSDTFFFGKTKVVLHEKGAINNEGTFFTKTEFLINGKKVWTPAVEKREFFQAYAENRVVV